MGYYMYIRYLSIKPPKVSQTTDVEQTNLINRPLSQTTDVEQTNLINRPLSQTTDVEQTNLINRPLSQTTDVEQTNLIFDCSEIYVIIELLTFLESNHIAHISMCPLHLMWTTSAEYIRSNMNTLDQIVIIRCNSLKGPG